MNRRNFVKWIREGLESQGVTKIRITPGLFLKKAEIQAKDPRWHSIQLEASYLRRRGKEILQISPVKDKLRWIDQLEELHAFFEE